jgi:hypothetical protein
MRAASAMEHAAAAQALALAESGPRVPRRKLTCAAGMLGSMRGTKKGEILRAPRGSVYRVRAAAAISGIDPIPLAKHTAADRSSASDSAVRTDRTARRAAAMANAMHRASAARRLCALSLRTDAASASSPSRSSRSSSLCGSSECGGLADPRSHGQRMKHGASCHGARGEGRRTGAQTAPKSGAAADRADAADAGDDDAPHSAQCTPLGCLLAHCRWLSSSDCISIWWRRISRARPRYRRRGRRLVRAESPARARMRRRPSRTRGTGCAAGARHCESGSSRGRVPWQFLS